MFSTKFFDKKKMTKKSVALWSFAAATIALEVFLLLRRALRKQSGPIPIPWIGPFLSMLYANNRQKRHAHLYEKYGAVVSVESVFYTTHIISDPELIAHVFKDTVTFRDRTTNSLFAYFTPMGLLSLSTDDMWKRHRSILSQMFTDKYLEHYVKIMRATASKLVAKWAASGSTSDLGKDLNALTLDILGSAVLGHDFEMLEDNENSSNELFDREKSMPYIIYLLLISSFPRWIKPFVPVPYYKKRAYAVDRMMRDLTLSLVKKAKEGNLDPHCLLSILLSVTPAWSEMEIMSELQHFILAGHETTANTLNFAFHLLSFHPEIQQKAREEIKAVGVGNVSKLQYCWAIFREALRLYPTVPNTARVVAATTTLPGGVTVGKHDIVVLNLVPASRDPAVYASPDEFRPSRWLDTLNHAEGFAHVPNFGGGLRRCIGQRFAEEEGIVILAAVLSSLEIHPGNQTQEAIETGNAVTLFAKDKIALKMAPILEGIDA